MNKTLTYSEIELGKMTPAAVELEELILAGILLEQEAQQDYLHLLHSDLWYKDTHRIIFDAIKQLQHQNKPIDIVTVTFELKRTEKLEQVGGPVYVTMLTSKLGSTANLGEYIAIVTQQYLRRQVILMANDLIVNAYDDSNDVFQVIDSIETGVQKINENILGSEGDGDISGEVEKLRKELYSPRKSDITGIETGNHELTNLTKGWNNGDLIIVGGKPSGKKTARTLQFLLFASLELKKKCAFFSLETSTKKLLKRSVRNISQVSALNHPCEDWSKEQMQKIDQALDLLQHSGIYVWDGSHLTPNKLISIVRRRQRKYGLELAVIDHLQLAKPDGKYSNPVEAMTELTRGLKLAAKTLNIPLIVLSQLSRESKNRAATSKRPVLSDLRQSGSIEQDADVVIFMYTPSDDYEKNESIYNLTDDQYKSMIEMIIAKNKDGELETVRELFNKYTQSFEPMPGTEIKNEVTQLDAF